MPKGGLSPRVRGNHAAALSRGRDVRSIPARAREPLAAARVKMPALVYPRACGGTKRVGVKKEPSDGLSPRVRGNRVPSLATFRDTRSIPARAGEPAVMRLPDPAEAGLSPRVRGNRPPGA